jgi:transcriptional regulator with XRE-family HTH domain
MYASRLSLDELAKRSGIEKIYLSQVLQSNLAIDEEIAAGLAKATHLPKTFWLELQDDYNATRIKYQIH